MADNLDIVLRGRKLKRISDIAFGELRRKYGLKQLEVEILIYLSRNPEASASTFIKEMGLNKGQVSVAMDNLSSGGFLFTRIRYRESPARTRRGGKAQSNV